MMTDLAGTAGETEYFTGHTLNEVTGMAIDFEANPSRYFL